MKARPKMKKHFIKKDTHQVLILHLKSNYIGSLSIQVFQYFITETLLA